jgi:hypothetical protein
MRVGVVSKDPSESLALEITEDLIPKGPRVDYTIHSCQTCR